MPPFLSTLERLSPLAICYFFMDFMKIASAVTLGPRGDHALEASHFGEKSKMMIALYPKTDKPWVLGMHQCSHARVWTQDERKLMEEIARRMTDVLTSLLAHRELRQSEERHRITLKTAMDGFFRTDMRGQILEVNEAYCRMTGYSEQEWLTMNIADISAVGSTDRMITELRKAAEGGPQRFETVHRRKDGKNVSHILLDVLLRYRGSAVASYVARSI